MKNTPLLGQDGHDHIQLRGSSFMKKPVRVKRCSPGRAAGDDINNAVGGGGGNDGPMPNTLQDGTSNPVQGTSTTSQRPPLSPVPVPVSAMKKGGATPKLDVSGGVSLMNALQSAAGASGGPHGQTAHASASVGATTPQAAKLPSQGSVPTTMLTTGPRSRLLPSPSKEAQEKPYTVVLDLDETVIYARDGPLYARAHLKDLLRTMHKYCEVIVWTAGEKSYAQAIMKEINCENIIEHLVYRHRKWFDPKDYTKDLKVLNRNMDYVLIIENTPDCIRSNPENGIIVEDFEGMTNEELDESTKQDPNVSLGEESEAGMNDAAAAQALAADENTEPSTPLVGSGGGGGGGGGSSSVPPSPSSAAANTLKKKKRKSRDNTLLYLMEVIENLGNSGGQTVPKFLASCSLLKKQIVYLEGDMEVPIFYLPSKRRPAGSEKMKVVKINKDRQQSMPEHIGDLSPKLVGQLTTTISSSTGAAAECTTPTRGTKNGNKQKLMQEEDLAGGATNNKRKRGGSATRGGGGAAGTTPQPKGAEAHHQGGGSAPVSPTASKKNAAMTTSTSSKGTGRAPTPLSAAMFTDNTNTNSSAVSSHKHSASANNNNNSSSKKSPRKVSPTSPQSATIPIAPHFDNGGSHAKGTVPSSTVAEQLQKKKMKKEAQQ